MSTQATTVFQDWLDQIDLSDYNTVYELYEIVQSLESFGSFNIGQAKGSSERWIVKSFDTDQPLMISGHKARQTFLDIIEDNYCEGLGIEGFYAFHHAMEKDD